jgi:hypothetical protein
MKKHRVSKVQDLKKALELVSEKKVQETITAATDTMKVKVPEAKAS